MSRIRRRFAAPLDQGASAVEYALLLAALAAVIIGVVFGLGGRVRSALDSTSTCINAKAREKKAEKKSDFFMF